MIHKIFLIIAYIRIIKNIMWGGEGVPQEAGTFFNTPFPQIEIGLTLPQNWNTSDPPLLPIQIQLLFFQTEYRPAYPLPPPN